jgi:integrase
MSLTDLVVKRAKPQVKPYKLADDKGLYLLVNTNGSKLWRWKYRVDGKEKLMSFGAYPEITLERARSERNEARKLLKGSVKVDPMAQRQADKRSQAAAANNSFQTVAQEWWKHWHTTKTERHATNVLRRLESDVFPKIGARPISEIQPSEIVGMVKAIEARGANDLAKRAFETCGQIFRFGIANDICQNNPTSLIKPSDMLKPTVKTNYARIDIKELPELMRRIEGYQGANITRLALKLMALTFVRTGELIGARWSEFDLEAGRWDIPAERMKMRTPHIVPLANQAIETLQVLHLLTGTKELLFPGERDHAKPMSNNTLLGALKRMGYQGRMTGHGFRGVASTQLHEMGFRHDFIELQLAHQQRNAVSAAYNHATYLKDRAAMMQTWADYLSACTSSKVIAGKFGKQIA